MDTDKKPQAEPADSSAQKYWKANLKLIGLCLSLWAFFSFGCAILFRGILSSIQFGGTDISFWFAQQGSIISFIAIIFFYSWKMNALDKKHGLEEE